MRWSRRYSSAKKRRARGGISPGCSRHWCTSCTTSPPAQKALGPLPRSITQAMLGSSAQALSLASSASIIGSDRAFRLFSASRLAMPMRIPCWAGRSSNCTFIVGPIVGWTCRGAACPPRVAVDKAAPCPPYGLFIAPLRVAFFQEGVDPFAGVVGVEQIDKTLALFTQPGIRAAFAGALDQRFDGAHRHRALPRDFRCQEQGMTTGLAAIDHLLDQADAQRGFRIDAFAAEDHALGPAFADQPAQVLGAAGAGQQADRGFWQGLLRLALGDADVAGQGTFQAAAHGVAVDRGNRYATEITQRFEGLAEAPGHFAGAGLVAIGEQLEVGAGAEELATLAGNHQGVNVIVTVEMFNQQLEADQRVAVPGVGRRLVDGDQRGIAVLFHGELVGQVEYARVVGFDGVAHNNPRKYILSDGTHALRGYPAWDALRPACPPGGTRSVRGGIPTLTLQRLDVGTIRCAGRLRPSP